MINPKVDIDAWNKAGPHKLKIVRKCSYHCHHLSNIIREENTIPSYSTKPYGNSFGKKYKIPSYSTKSPFNCHEKENQFQKRIPIKKRKVHYHKSNKIQCTLNHSYHIKLKLDTIIKNTTVIFIQNKIDELSEKLIKWSIKKAFNISINTINIVIDVGKITVSLNEIYKSRSTYQLLIDIVDGEARISGNSEELKTFFILHKDLVMEILKLSKDCVLL